MLCKAARPSSLRVSVDFAGSKIQWDSIMQFIRFDLLEGEVNDMTKDTNLSPYNALAKVSRNLSKVMSELEAMEIKPGEPRKLCLGAHNAIRLNVLKVKFLGEPYQLQLHPWAEQWQRAIAFLHQDLPGMKTCRI